MAIDKSGTERIVKARIGSSIGLLNPIWSSRVYRDSTKLGILNTNVKAVLLYVCESRKITKSIENGHYWMKLR